MVDVKISQKSMPCTCEYLYITNLAFNLAIKLLGLYFILNTHLDPIIFCPRRGLLFSYIWYFSKFCNSSSIAFLQRQPWIRLLIVLLYDFALCILLFVLINDIATSCLSILLLTTIVSIRDSFKSSLQTSIRDSVGFFYGLSLGLNSLAGGFFLIVWGLTAIWLVTLHFSLIYQYMAHWQWQRALFETSIHGSTWWYWDYSLLICFAICFGDQTLFSSFWGYYSE